MIKNRAAFFGLTLALTVALPSLAASLTYDGPPPNGGDGGFPVGGSPPPVHHIPLPPPVFTTPPPSDNSGPPAFVPPPVTGVFINPLQQTDTARDRLYTPPNPTTTTIATAGGIQTISDNEFLRSSSGDESADWILVRGDEQAVYERTTPMSVTLKDGTILVSVRRPSKYALINTPDGVISIGADGDVLISLNAGVIRVDNVSGRGIRCKVKLNDNVLDGHSQAVAIAPGYELVAGDHKLVRSDVRPADGIARRGFELLANGHVAVNEFSVESFLSNSAIIATLSGQANDPKDHRILKDMSKMAAVLNYVNGPAGYTSQTGTGLATKPGGETH